MHACAKWIITLVIMVVIYISPNSKLEDIEFFIQRAVLEYTKEGSLLLGKNFHQLSLILAGDFNVNFADPKSDLLKLILLNKFDLKLNNDPAISTTKYGRTIDAVFQDIYKILNLKLACLISVITNL